MWRWETLFEEGVCIGDGDEYMDFFMSPFNVEDGPLCRFAIEEGDEDEKEGGDVLLGCVHHSIADGRSMELLVQWVGGEGRASAGAKEYSVRRYAAMEAMQLCRENEWFGWAVGQWQKVLGDTPGRFECGDIVPCGANDGSGAMNGEEACGDFLSVRVSWWGG